MAKKPAKRSKPKRKTIRTYQLDLFGGKKLVARRSAPTKAELASELAKEAESEREWAAYLASDEYRQIQAREAAAKSRHRERLARRPVEMQRRSYRLPADVQSFLAKLHKNPLSFASIDGVHSISTDEAAEMIEAAYWEGCRQGFIEGFLYGEDHARPGALKNRERLRRQNLEKLERLGIADRNAEIVAEFHRLECEMPGKDQRYKHLAQSAEDDKRRSDWPTSDRQIGEIIRKASKRRR